MVEWAEPLLRTSLGGIFEVAELRSGMRLARVLRFCTIAAGWNSSGVPNRRATQLTTLSWAMRQNSVPRRPIAVIPADPLPEQCPDPFEEADPADRRQHPTLWIHQSGCLSMTAVRSWPVMGGSRPPSCSALPRFRPSRSLTSRTLRREYGAGPTPSPRAADRISHSPRVAHNTKAGPAPPADGFSPRRRPARRAVGAGRPRGGGRAPGARAGFLGAKPPGLSGPEPSRSPRKIQNIAIAD